jgi:uncharacterized protein (DUF3084 family)
MASIHNDNSIKDKLLEVLNNWQIDCVMSYNAARDLGSIAASHNDSAIEFKLREVMTNWQIYDVVRDGAADGLGTIIKIRSKQKIENDMRARVDQRDTSATSSGEGSSSRTRSPERELTLDQMRKFLDKYSRMEERKNKLKQERDQAQTQLTKVQQDLNRALEQFTKVQQERDQARGERDRLQRQLGDTREERDQARNELREAQQNLNQAREERDQAQRQLREMERARNQVQARERSAANRRNEAIESTFKKLRFMNNLDSNIEEILRERLPEADCLRRVRDLYRNKMNAALNIELTREQFAQDFRNCVEQMAKDWNVPDDLHLKFSNNIETITKIVKNLEDIFQRYDHEEVLLIQVRELYTSTLRDSTTSGMNRQEIAQEFKNCVEKIMDDRDISESIRARVMEYDKQRVR